VAHLIISLVVIAGCFWVILGDHGPEDNTAAFGVLSIVLGTWTWRNPVN